MDITINISDYLSDEEIKEECKQAIYARVKETYRVEADMNRLVSNLSCQMIYDMVDAEFDGDLKQTLKDNILKAVAADSLSYCVFRRKNEWERSESPAVKILDEECIAARPLIKARVEEIIQQYPFYELKNDQIGDVIYECIMDKLFGDDKSND